MTKMTPAVSSRPSLRTTGRTTVLGLGMVGALALAGCGSGADDPVVAASGSTSSSTSTPASPSATSPSATPSSSSSTNPAGPTLEITITGRTVDPAPSTVRLGVGETLTLTVTSDHHDELHIHGFEVAKELPAGVAQTVTVTGKEPGVYEVETHHPELRLLKIAVQ